MELYMCRAYNKNKYSNMFSRRCFYEHAKRNKSNVTNCIKFVF